MVDPDRVMGKAKEMGGAAQGAIGDVVGSPGNSAEGRFRQAEGAVENFYGQAKDAAADLGSNAGAYARQGAEATREQVGQHPLTAVLLAGVVGYFVALIMHPRH